MEPTTRKPLLLLTQSFVIALALGVIVSLGGTKPVWADGYSGGGPPPWAPAHGYRNKHKHKKKHKRTYEYVDETAHEHKEPVDDAYPVIDVGILTGTCRREAVGAVLGGVAGGVIGHELGKGDNQRVATVAGAVIGVLVGSQIGRAMDEHDRYCTGQVLEQTPDRQVVAWHNPETRSEYRVTPVASYESQGRYCREYVTDAPVEGRYQHLYGTACRNADGSWQVVN